MTMCKDKTVELLLKLAILNEPQVPRKPCGEPIHLSSRGIEGSEGACADFRLASTCQWRERVNDLRSWSFWRMDWSTSSACQGSPSRVPTAAARNRFKSRLTGGWRASRGLAVCAGRFEERHLPRFTRACAQSRIARSKVIWRSRSLRCNSQRKNGGTKPCVVLLGKEINARSEICAC